MNEQLQLQKTTKYDYDTEYYNPEFDNEIITNANSGNNTQLKTSNKSLDIEITRTILLKQNGYSHCYFHMYSTIQPIHIEDSTTTEYVWIQNEIPTNGTNGCINSDDGDDGDDDSNDDDNNSMFLVEYHPASFTTLDNYFTKQSQFVHRFITAYDHILAAIDIVYNYQDVIFNDFYDNIHIKYILIDINNEIPLIPVDKKNRIGIYPPLNEAIYYMQSNHIQRLSKNNIDHIINNHFTQFNILLTSIVKKTNTGKSNTDTSHITTFLNSYSQKITNLLYKIIGKDVRTIRSMLNNNYYTMRFRLIICFLSIVNNHTQLHQWVLDALNILLT